MEGKEDRATREAHEWVEEEAKEKEERREAALVELRLEDLLMEKENFVKYMGANWRVARGGVREGGVAKENYFLLAPIPF